jgi:hypothetical protein
MNGRGSLADNECLTDVMSWAEYAAVYERVGTSIRVQKKWERSWPRAIRLKLQARREWQWQICGS